MLSKHKIAAAILAVTVIVQSSGVCFAISDKSHMFNRVRSRSYADFATQIQDLIDDYDDEDSYLESIEMQIGSSEMIVNGDTQSIDAQGTAAGIYDGSTMVPARALAENLGCSVEWDATNQRVRIISEEEGKKIEIPINRAIIEVNGSVKEIQAAARIERSRTLVPARALCEALDCEVDWDGNTQTVTITKKFQTRRLIVKLKNSSLEFQRYGAVDVIYGPNNEYAIVQFGSAEDTKAAYEQLQNNRDVLSVEPDVVLMGNEVNAANSLSNSWDTDYTQIVYFANTIPSQKTMRIGVVDSGVNGVGILSGKVDGGVNCIGSSNGASDVLGHGTNVAGIIAKSMGNVNFQIVPIKITDTATFNMTASIFGTAIHGCIENKVDVINMSISIPNAVNSDYIDDGIRSALEKKIPVVVAAGNDGNDIAMIGNMLASRDDVIVVAATNKDNRKADFSSYGTTVDLCAPGEDVTSVGRNGNENVVSGTSFSSPHVAAAAALIKAKNSSMTPAQIESELKKNVKTPAGWLTHLYGAGILFFDVPGVEIAKKLSASNLTVQVNAAAQVAVRDGAGNVVDVASCTYTSSDESVATISSSGVVTGKKAGTANIKIKSKNEANLETQIIVTVLGASEEKTVVGYEFGTTNNSVELKPGNTYNLSVYEVYSDGSKVNATEKIQFASSNPAVATISSTGKITAVAVGSANISFSSVASVTISLPRPFAVKVTDTPVAPAVEITAYEWSTDTKTELKVGETTTLRLFEVYSDGSKVDATNRASVTSSNPGVATISNNGKITAVAAGTTNMVFSSISGSIKIPRPMKITVIEDPQQPVEPEIVKYEWSSDVTTTLEVGEITNVKLYAVYSDGNKVDVTRNSALYSTDTDVIEINSAGKIEAVGDGRANIMPGQAAVASTVQSARPLSITVNKPIEANPEFEYDSYGGGVAITAYTGSERYVTIPETLGGEDVVAIGEKAFYGNRNISSVSMPTTIETIESYAFANCKSLKSVHFSSAITEIGAHAFDDCTSLTGVTLPSGITEIASYTFRGCTALKKIKIPSGVSSIGDSAFANCRSLTITIPDSVTDIASSAFTRGNSIKISGREDSAAAAYAQEKGFSFN